MSAVKTLPPRPIVSRCEKHPAAPPPPRRQPKDREAHHTQNVPHVRLRERVMSEQTNFLPEGPNGRGKTIHIWWS